MRGSTKYATAFLAGVMVALSGCASAAPDLGPPASDDRVQAQVYAAPYDEVYAAALEVAEALRWQITEADKEGRLILAETPEATPDRALRRDAYEDEVSVVFEPTGEGVRVEVTSGVRMEPNHEDARAFLEAIEEQLESDPS